MSIGLPCTSSLRIPLCQSLKLLQQAVGLIEESLPQRISDEEGCWSQLWASAHTNVHTHTKKGEVARGSEPFKIAHHPGKTVSFGGHWKFGSLVCIVSLSPCISPNATRLPELSV